MTINRWAALRGAIACACRLKTSASGAELVERDNVRAPWAYEGADALDKWEELYAELKARVLMHLN